MKTFQRARSGVTHIAVCAAAFVAANPVYAADTTATGIDGSFTTMLDDLTGMLGGNFGALVLLISLIIAVGVYAVTSNWRFVIASVMVAFLIGYGVDIIQGIGGVTATIDLVGAEQIALLSAQSTATLPQ